jgi:hypothetical protein
MTPEDEAAFVARLIRDDVVWMPRRLHLGHPHTPRELAELISSAEDLVVIIRRADWERLEIKPCGPDPTSGSLGGGHRQRLSSVAAGGSRIASSVGVFIMTRSTWRMTIQEFAISRTIPVNGTPDWLPG